ERVHAPLAGADPRHVMDRHAPDLAVADPPGLRRLQDDVDDVVRVDVVDQHLQADLGDEVHGVLRAPVDLAVATLPAVAAGLAHRHARDPEGLQGLLDLVQLVRLDDRGDEFHADAPCVGDADGTEWAPTGGRVAVVSAPAPIRPPPSEPRSYDVSACSCRSIPEISASWSIRKPRALCSASPMTEVTRKEKARTAKAPTACRHSWSTPPP